ncbi:MAG: thioredoxin family protein [Myxococcota bacterium]
MAKPSVDGLQQDLSERLAFTHVNIGDEEGRRLATKYGVRAVPAFLVVSPEGEVLYRKIGGLPEREAIEAELARPH